MPSLIVTFDLGTVGYNNKLQLYNILNRAVNKGQVAQYSVTAQGFAFRPLQGKSVLTSITPYITIPRSTQGPLTKVMWRSTLSWRRGSPSAHSRVSRPDQYNSLYDCTQEYPEPYPGVPIGCQQGPGGAVLSHPFCPLPGKSVHSHWSGDQHTLNPKGAQL